MIPRPLRAGLLGCALALVAGPAGALEIPREHYLEYMPLSRPRIVARTEASRLLRLFGDPADPGYRDTDPRDGIDDRRGRVLQALARRFSVDLVRNSEMVPTDFRRYLGHGPFLLTVDTWDVSRTPARLLGSRRLERDDELAALLRREAPGGPEDSTAGPQPAERDPLTVMYFDLPGDGPDTWRAEYRRMLAAASREPSTAVARQYAHPFLSAVPPAGGGAPRYELVIQYWFFYPYNDGGNKHEGDWEHLNAVVVPRGSATAGLDADMVRAILEGAIPPERMVLARVESYFHNHVMLLDYLRPNAYASRDAWRAEADTLDTEKRGTEHFWAQIRERAYLDPAESAVNPHPLGYIGGNDKGPEEVLSWPGAKNQDSHGTYPFPGLYKNVGPGGTGEEIRARSGYPRLEATHPGSREMRRLERFPDSSSVELVPDWECVLPRALEDPAVRDRWSWLLLPVHWGYPATHSPLAGVVRHADTGNLAPLGPAYNPGWNRTGACAGYSLYDPQRFSSVFAMGYQDHFVNSLGFLNLTVPSLFSLPPFDLASTLFRAGQNAVRRDPRPTLFPRDRIPFRLVGVAFGYSLNDLGENFVNLLTLPGPYTDIKAFAAGTDTTAVTGTPSVKSSWSGFAQLNLYLGLRYASENTLRHGRATVATAFSLPSQGRDVALRGQVEMWEYSGSLRYNLKTGAVQPFVKLGYGLSWYRLTGVTMDGVPLAHPETPWVHRPSLSRPASLLPNTWHAGAGVELLPIRSEDPADGAVDLGVRADFTVFSHRMGLDVQPGDLLFTPDATTIRTQFNLSLTLSY